MSLLSKTGATPISEWVRLHGFTEERWGNPRAGQSGNTYWSKTYDQASEWGMHMFELLYFPEDFSGHVTSIGNPAGCMMIIGAGLPRSPYTLYMHCEDTNDLVIFLDAALRNPDTTPQWVYDVYKNISFKEILGSL